MRHMTDDQRDRAIERIKQKRGFWTHLAIYVAVNALLVVIWFTQGTDQPFWPIWVLFGWGIGVAAHAFGVFIAPREISEERIQKEIDRGV